MMLSNVVFVLKTYFGTCLPSLFIFTGNLENQLVTLDGWEMSQKVWKPVVSCCRWSSTGWSLQPTDDGILLVPVLYTSWSRLTMTFDLIFDDCDDYCHPLGCCDLISLRPVWAVSQPPWNRGTRSMLLSPSFSAVSSPLFPIFRWWKCDEIPNYVWKNWQTANYFQQ